MQWATSRVRFFKMRGAKSDDTSMAEIAMNRGMMLTTICTAAMFSLGKVAATCATIGTGTNMPMMLKAAA